tara:strand:+ start:6441 stop:7088 length:648 start_codon:yes stop_codon:yes gene_type:complete
MANRKTTKKAPKNAVAKARGDRHDKIHRDFCRRHPARARSERALRKEQEAAERDFGHKRNGTVETLQKASRVRQGSLARLYEAGQLSADQLAASQEIRTVAERIGMDVKVGTCSLEARVDNGRKGSALFFERLGAVRAEVAYGHWRRAQGDKALPLLEMIVHDQSLSATARAYGMRKETARELLSRALDAWSDYIGAACNAIDQAEMLAAQAGLI